MQDLVADMHAACNSARLGAASSVLEALAASQYSTDNTMGPVAAVLPKMVLTIQRLSTGEMTVQLLRADFLAAAARCGHAWPMRELRYT